MTEPRKEGGFDSTAFRQQAVAGVRGQLERSELHDPDFAAFRQWTGTPIEVILDVGANKGQSLASLHAVFPEAEIHSFEANPLFFDVLEEVASAVDGTCVVHRYGLGRQNGQLTLFVPWAGDEPFLEESSTILDYYQKPWVAQKFAERGGLALQDHLVDIRRGDDLGLRPQLMKIDVEGAEGEVIAGLATTIRLARPMLLVENSDWHGVTALLAKFGYRPYRYEAAEDWLVPFYGSTTNSFYIHYEHLRGFRTKPAPMS